MFSITSFCLGLLNPALGFLNSVLNCVSKEILLVEVEGKACFLNLILSCTIFNLSAVESLLELLAGIVLKLVLLLKIGGVWLILKLVFSWLKLLKLVAS